MKRSEALLRQIRKAGIGDFELVVIGGHQVGERSRKGHGLGI
jgi:hypothetical protein